MSLWEYKVITSGKGGFATPAMLEKFLNDLGRDEWEIIEYHSTPDNLLAFTGLARRTTQRDWTLQDAAAAAAKAEAEKLRAEFAAKFEAATKTAPASAEAPPASFIEEKAGPDDGFRKPVDTSRDDDPEAHDEPKDDWDKLTASEEEELPAFFDAIKPHMRRNQRGPGMSVGTDYLAKKWDQTEDDIKGALVECGFVMPADEESKVEYVEYDGDLYWLNINRRGELWINTKEKPRPIFRNVKATRIEMPAEEPKPEQGGAPAGEPASGRAHFEPRGRREGRDGREGRDDQQGGRNPQQNQLPSEQPAAAPAQSDAPAATGGTNEGGSVSGGGTQAPAGGNLATTPLPTGPEFLNKIRPHMRRNRRGPGGSGSTSFLARALRRNEADLITAFNGLGLVLPPNPNDKPILVEFGNEIWWLNQDSRGGVWINGRDKKDGEVLSPAGATPAPTSEGMSAPATTDTATAPASDVSAPAASAPAGEAMTPTASDSAGVASAETAQVAAAIPPTPTPATETPTEQPAQPAESAFAAPAASPAPTNSTLAAVRLLLKETRTGALAGKLERVAEEIGKSPDDLTAALVTAGLKVPEKAKEKPVFVEHAGEIFWFNKNAKDELWINAKASKYADKDGDGEEDGEGDGEKKPARRGGRAPRGKKTE
jgi:hypothetical protein